MRTQKNSEPITVYVGHWPSRASTRGPYWHFWCDAYRSVEGYSYEPLLEACRMLLDGLRGPDRQRRVNLVDHETGMIRLTGIVSKAARLTVKEGQKESPRFGQWTPHDQRGYPTT